MRTGAARDALHATLPLILAAAGLIAPPHGARAQEPAVADVAGPTTAEAPRARLFLGYETEPAMDLGGRVVASADALVAGAFGGIRERHPALAPAWEFPLAAALLLVEHEGMGHGGRARELGLGPSYGAGFDFSAYTTTRRAPRDHEELALLAAGGVEADGVMAHRLLLDALGDDGIDGAQLPLVMMAKLDLTVYVASAPRPRPGDDEGDFSHEYRHGNDMVLYLTGRQAARLGADAGAVWDGTYEPDFGEPLLRRTWDDARAAALWNLLDPSLGAAMVGYFRQHVLGGEARVRPPTLRIGEPVRLTLATRAALGPDSMSRFLDVQLALPRGVVDIFARRFDSAVASAWGWGAALHRMPLGRLALSVGADAWDEPRTANGAGEGSGWNAVAEVEARRGRWAVVAKLGDKSGGFFPGTPRAAGVYGGGGLVVDW
jgi:hypothetical protein